MAATPALRMILLLFLIGIVQARILTLRLNSFDDDQLISDGVDHHFENQSSSPVSVYSSAPSIPSTCNHQYGFLPCAENAAGYIFQILVYQGLLMFGERQIGRGSQVLFHIIGAGKIGGIIFRILMSLPSMMLMIVSGVFSSKENAQSQVSLGVGIYAGMTVFSLTLQWGVCVIFGRRELTDKSKEPAEASQSSCLQAKEKLIILKDTGVLVDHDTRSIALIMLLSLIPYIVVQLVDFFHTPSANRIITLTALIVSSVSLIAYFGYQMWDPLVQQRSLEYAKYETLRTKFLEHVKRQGQLVNEDGTLNTDAITKLFVETDKDKNKSITQNELEKLVLDIITTGKMNIDKKIAIADVMETFDFNEDGCIKEQEFIEGCRRWIEDTKQTPENSDASSTNIFQELLQLFSERKENDPKEIERIMSKILKHAETKMLKAESLITPEGKPNTEQIQNLFRQFDTDGNKSISASELEQLLTTVKFGESQIKHEDIVKELFKDFDVNHNTTIDQKEFEDGVTKWLNRAIDVAKTTDKRRIIDEYDKIVWKQPEYGLWDFIMSVFQVLAGILMLTFLGGPLMTSILQLSYAMRLSSFSISFVIVPLAMNARTAITALLPAKQKNERSASLTFSEIYGGVIMNNIAGLTTLLAIVFAKELTWDFSAEVLTILVVCAIIGILAYSCNTYPLWTCILAFFLYPFSLGMYYFVQMRRVKFLPQ
ncbi:UNVERIFIED_CONTAM: Sodium/calcium exchanger NCL1 [Sesamum angustifolium]|uniref:Sodium/calcium exchanger NCL1 n=1 Tax=Sesamum angustifolium TaxID=2727405 RepID=A0AAW2PAA3_9LAMI